MSLPSLLKPWLFFFYYFILLLLWISVLTRGAESKATFHTSAHSFSLFSPVFLFSALLCNSISLMIVLSLHFSGCLWWKGGISLHAIPCLLYLLHDVVNVKHGYLFKEIIIDHFNDTDMYVNDSSSHGGVGVGGCGMPTEKLEWWLLVAAFCYLSIYYCILFLFSSSKGNLWMAGKLTCI